MHSLKSKETLIISIAALFMFITTALLTFLSLNRTPFANGWDGYYYLVQVKAYLTEGSMHSPDISLIYPLLISIEYFVRDYILSYKICAAVVRGLFTLSVFILSLTITVQVRPAVSFNKKFFTSLGTAAVSLASPSAFFFISQFPKNMLGFALLLFFLSALLDKKYVITGRRSFSLKTIIVFKYVIILFIAAFITHRFAGALALVTIGIFLVHALYKNRNYRLLATGAVLLLLILVLSLAFPGTLHLVDLERFRGLFSFRPQLAPISFIQLLGYQKIGPAWSIELFLYFFLVTGYTTCAVIYYAFYKKALPGFTVLMVPLFFCLPGIFPFYHFDLSGMAYRFFLGFVLFSPLLLVPVMLKIKKGFLITLIIVVLAGSFFTKNSYDPGRFDPPYKFYYRLSVDIINRLRNTDYTLLIAHKGLAEVITFTTGRDALPWAAGKQFTPGSVWRVTAGVTDSHLQQYLPDNIFNEYTAPLPGDYQLIREDAWKLLVDNIKKSGDTGLFKIINSWRNPLQVRPQFVLKGRH